MPNVTTVWSKAVDQILGVGRSLEDVGVRNWALTRAQALDALIRLDTAQIAILGGDVYELRDGILRPRYDNWHCDRKQNESGTAFATRSVAAARSYIADYRPEKETEVFFVIVPDT